VSHKGKRKQKKMNTLIYFSMGHYGLNEGKRKNKGRNKKGRIIVRGDN